MEYWSLKIPDYRKSNINNLRFIYEEANEALNYSIRKKENVGNRAFTILSYLVPIISLMVGLLWNQVFSIERTMEESTICFLIWAIAPLIIFLALIIWIIFPKNFHPLGFEPKKINAEEFVYSTKLESIELEKALLINRLKDLQIKLDHNNMDNNRRLFVLKTMLIGLSVYFCTVFIVLLTCV